MIAAFYGFQRAPDTRHVERPSAEKTGGWLGWFETEVEPLLACGVRDFHVHNPFGLYEFPDRIKPNGTPWLMHIDQFELARCNHYSWLANPQEFRQVVSVIHERGAKIRAYVGSPLVIPKSPSVYNLKRYTHCNPDGSNLGNIFWWINILTAFCSYMPGICERPLTCFVWRRFTKAHIQVLIDAQVDAIGFDSSYDFHKVDCMFKLVEELLDLGIEVMLEPWPRADRSYPRVSWIMREQKYQQIKHEPKKDQAPLNSVRGPIYRIVPNHNGAQGKAELKKISDLTGIKYSFTKQVVESVLEDGNIPMVRWRQLLNRDVVIT